MEITSTKNIEIQKIKILTHGPAGSGKTRLCSTTGGTPIILSAEAGLLSLAEFDIDVIQIKAMQDLRDAYTYLKGDSKYDWVCLDSVSEIAEMLLSEEKAKTNDPRKAYGELQDQMMQIMRAFRDLDKNIYFSAKQEKVKDEVTGGLLFGPSAPGQRLATAMPYLFDEIFALHTWKDEEGNTQSALQTHRDNQYEAKDRSGKLEFSETADLSQIHNKIIKSKTKEKK